MRDPIYTIADYVHTARYEHLSPQVVDAVKKAIIDTVGAGIAGSSAPMGKMVADLVAGKGGEPRSTLWTRGVRVPTTEAAFANAIMARCLELDDVHEGSLRTGMGHGGHVSVMTLPAALAAAEATDSAITGKELLCAAAIGGDLIPRLRMAGGAGGRLGWEGATVAAFGVAAAVGKLWHFSPDTLVNAMGAAYAHCSGNIQSNTDGTWDGWLNAGIGARAGIISAEFARLGHQGTKSPLMGVAGLYPLYFRNEFHEAALLSELGTSFESANVSIKPYSSCKCTHHAIYTTLELIKKHDIHAAQIRRVVVRSCEYNMRITARDQDGNPKRAPASVGEAQFNMAFTMAMAIIKGTVFPDVLTNDSLTDPEILRIFNLIEIEETAEKNELQKKEGYPPDDVDIHTNEGVYRGCEIHVKGHPLHPMALDEVAEKFWRCAKLSRIPIEKGKLDRFLSDVLSIEDLADVRTLVNLFH